MLAFLLKYDFRYCIIKEYDSKRKERYIVAEKSSIFEKVSAETVSLSISLPKDMKATLQEKAKEVGLSSSYYCRKIFDIYLEHEDEIIALAEGRAKVVIKNEE